MGRQAMKPQRGGGLLAALVWCCALVGGRASGFSQDGVTALNDQDPSTKQKVGQSGLSKKVVGNHLPGVPYTEVGYPKQRRLKGAEAKKLHYDGPNHGDVSHLADERVYPNSHMNPLGGVMTAEDIRELMSEVDPFLSNIKSAKLKERKFAEMRENMRNFQMKVLADKIGGGVNGEELLSGAIENQLGMLKGNLGLCQKKVANCKSSKRELGEGQSPEQMDTTSPKHTAMEEDMMRRGIEHPAANIKAKPATKGETKTASEEYVDAQRGSFWKKLPHEPGFKMSYDRITQSQLKQLVKSTRKSIKDTKVLEKKEMADGYRKIEDANKKAVSALLSVAKVKQALDKSKEIPTTKSVLEDMSKTQDELMHCMVSLKSDCNQKMRLAEPAASTAMTPGSLFSNAQPMPHPEDDTALHGAGVDSPPSHKEVKDDPGQSASPNDRAQRKL